MSREERRKGKKRGNRISWVQLFHSILVRERPDMRSRVDNTSGVKKVSGHKPWRSVKNTVSIMKMRNFTIASNPID